MTVKRCAADVVQYILRFSKCLHVNRDRNSVLVNYALQKISFGSWCGKLYKDFFKPFVQTKTTAHSQFSSFQALF